LDGQIALALTADGVGPVRVTGEAIDAKEDGNRLQFRFEIDQTEVPAICQSLSNLLSAFPVMGLPDAEQA
jgi:hypothetical protein